MPRVASRNLNGWLADLQQAAPLCLDAWRRQIELDLDLQAELCGSLPCLARSQQRASKLSSQSLANAALQLSLIHWFDNSDAQARDNGNLVDRAETDLLNPRSTAKHSLLATRLQWPSALQQALGNAPLDAICERLANYGCGGPLIHYFHEWVSQACNAANKRLRGVYYTPYPMAQFIVKRVQCLASDWDQENTLVLDPSCGSGVFLHAAANQWKHAVLRGFELSSASACCAEFLTERAAPNAEIQWIDSLQVRETDLPAAAGVRRTMKRLIILGNPPYSNFGRGNRSAWLAQLLTDYKHGLKERKHNLHDDFIKFLRWSQHQVDQVGEGIVAFVLNHSFLNGLTQRVMRHSLMQSFDTIEVLDLHGNVDKRETADDDLDENVFGIRQGVAIVLFQKHRRDRKSRLSASFSSGSIRGPREFKFQRLAAASHLKWQRWTPAAPNYSYTQPPRLDSAAGRSSDQQASSYSTLNEAVHYRSGVQTKCDRLFVDFCPQALARRMRRWLSGESVEALPQAPRWLLAKREASVFDANYIQPYMIAPLDVRYVYYDPNLIGRARFRILQSMLAPQAKGLVFMRQSTNPGPYDHFLAVDCLVSDRVFFSAHGAPFLAPFGAAYESGSRATVKLRQWAETHWLAEDLDGDGTPRRFWEYYYGLFHSRGYRTRFREQLRSSFPPLPPPHYLGELEALSELGRQLMRVHIDGASQADELSESDDVSTFQNIAHRPRFDAAQGQLFVNDVDRLQVSSDAWNWTIGGYPVLRRWLSQRKGRAFDSVCRGQLIRRISCFQQSYSLITKIDNILQAYRSY